MRLSELATSQKGTITKIHGHGAFRKRIMEMGFIRGKNVEVIRNAPLLDPVEYRIMGYNVSLRRQEAWLVEVIAGEEYRVETVAQVRAEESGRRQHSHNLNGKVINVALVGNPNSGKTSLFNQASGAHERTGNYSGVTIEARETTIHHKGYRINLTDLPGTYSVTEYTPEELFVRTRLLAGRPDVVINVVDASNLERNLYLTTQLTEMNVRVIMALNMYDELQKSGAKLKYRELGALMGIPVVPTVAVRGRGIIDLLDRVVAVFRDEDPISRPVRINYGNTLEKSLEKLQAEILRSGGSPGGMPVRYLAIKLLEGDRSVTEMITDSSGHLSIPELARAERSRLAKACGQEADSVMADARYGFIAGALAETMTAGRRENKKSGRDPDYWLTHRILGYPIFLAFLFIM